MNEQVAKKVRQLTRRNWKLYLKDIKRLPFKVRFKLAWWIAFGKMGQGQ